MQAFESALLHRAGRASRAAASSMRQCSCASCVCLPGCIPCSSRRAAPPVPPLRGAQPHLGGCGGREAVPVPVASPRAHSPISGYSVRVSGSSVKVPRAVAGASTSAPARPSGGGFESGVRRAAAPTQPAVVRGAARPLQPATLRLHGAEHDGQEQECGAGGAMPSAWCSSARSHAGLCVLLQPRTAMLRR